MLQIKNLTNFYLLFDYQLIYTKNQEKTFIKKQSNM